MSKYKYLLKNTGILAISNFSSKLLVFFLVPIYTKVLTTEEYGIYDLVFSTVTLLYPILTMNIVDGVMRFSMERDADYKKIFSVALRFVILGFIIAGVLLYCNYKFGFWKKIQGIECLIFFYYFSYVMNQLMIQFSKGLERIKDMGIAGIIGTIAVVVSNILFLITFNLGLSGFFVANMLGQIIPAVYMVIRLKVWRYVGINIDKSLLKKMLVYSAPLMLTTIGWWVNSASDKYVVTFVLGVAANGLLSIAYKIPTILNTMQSIFIQAWQVSAIKEYETSETKAFYKNTFEYLNALICVGCSFLIFFTRPIARILYANDFYNAWEFVPFLLVSSVLNSSSGYIGPILAARKDSKSMATSAIWGSLINVVLNVIFVYLIGIQGAAIATVISSYVIYIVRKKAIGDVLISDRYKYIVMSWVLLISQAACEIYIQSYAVGFIFVVIIISIYANSIFYWLSMLRKY